MHVAFDCLPPQDIWLTSVPLANTYFDAFIFNDSGVGISICMPVLLLGPT